MNQIQTIKQRFGIIGRSTGLDHAISTAIRVAATDLTVLISGESGVGKEAIFHIIHALSSRKHNKSIAINCGAIPEGTINSELFGHEKGAFTGATSERRGYFETVDGGTIFLDEIGEMPLDTQTFLLRVLENGEFMKVGSSSVVKTNVRVVAASNVNLLEQVEKGKFREDLYYRLSTVPIALPPLRERKEDIFMLFRKFAVDTAEKYKTSPVRLDDSARMLIENYAWPGNIRELKNVVEQVSVLSEEKNIDADMLMHISPSLGSRNLPSKINLRQGSDGSSFEEREILYKLLFDMKKDLNDLKSLVLEVSHINDLDLPDGTGSPGISFTGPQQLGAQFTDQSKEYSSVPTERSADMDPSKPIIIQKEDEEKYNRMEIVEENLSIEDMEKDLIGKALEKYKGRRKEAALELGISERTLYRKIKQYGLQG